MSRHHRAQRWEVHNRRLRPIIEAQLPLPCVECGRPVQRTDLWEVGHRTPAALGGQPTVENTGAVHTGCNRRSGGKLGATITNAQRPAAVRRGFRAW